MRLRTIVSMLFTVLLSACATLPAPDERRQAASALARERGWQGLELRTSSFSLQAYVPGASPADDELTLYIEGDGLAWISGRQPSSDPTPLDPLGLRLALAHPQGNAVYLGRPCQYLGNGRAPCGKAYWTGARFAEQVVHSIDQATDQLKARAGAQRLVLVGYSGGGALAMLLAARRRDVVQVVTVAGNLDHAAWTQHHRVTPLHGSLNPERLRPRLAHLRQLHLVGERDRITPPELAQAFVAGYPPGHQARVEVLPGYDHRCCWAEDWKSLWQLSRER